uniref:Kinesin motor domain-containing protein n=1 Tax=Rhizochromulina marina TaxID=1034831 RepID=A0A7S2S969_9STRA
MAHDRDTRIQPITRAASGASVESEEDMMARESFTQRLFGPPSLSGDMSSPLSRRKVPTTTPPHPASAGDSMGSIGTLTPIEGSDLQLVPGGTTVSGGRQESLDSVASLPRPPTPPAPGQSATTRSGPGGPRDHHAGNGVTHRKGKQDGTVPFPKHSLDLAEGAARSPRPIMASPLPVAPGAPHLDRLSVDSMTPLPAGLVTPPGSRTTSLAPGSLSLQPGRGILAEFVEEDPEKALSELLMSPKARAKAENKALRQIDVAIRVRPFLEGEYLAGREKPADLCTLAIRGERTMMLAKPNVLPGASTELITDMVLAGTGADLDFMDWARCFQFDRCLWSLNKDQMDKYEIHPRDYVDQDGVFDKVGLPVVDSLFSGVDVTCFAYGQTNTGKTYSMFGADPIGLQVAHPRTYGLVPNSLLEIVARCAELEHAMQDRRTSLIPDGELVAVHFNIVEIYNDRIRDLLAPEREEPLPLREDKLHGPYVDHVQNIQVDLGEEELMRSQHILELLGSASTFRNSHDNGENKLSSRGHVVVTVEVIVDGQMSKAQFVDLAGSERQDPAGTTSRGKSGSRNMGSTRSPRGLTAASISQRQREMQEINRSLANLNFVINGLAKGEHPSNLPFRESKLTRMLKRGLTGESHIVMLATVSPAPQHYDETLQTLLYAERLKKMSASLAPVPIKKMVDTAVIQRVLEDPEDLLRRMDAFEKASRHHRGGAGHRGKKGNDANHHLDRKASMFSVQVSDPQQRLVRLRHFLKSLLPPPSDEDEFEGLRAGDARGDGNSSLGPRRLSLMPYPSAERTPSRIASSPALTTPQSARSGTGALGGDVAETSRLQNTIASLEMDLYTLQVDKDVIDLKLSEAQQEKSELQEKLQQLEGIEREAGQLTEDREDLQYRLDEALRLNEGLRLEIEQIRQEAHNSARLREFEQDEMIRFNEHQQRQAESLQLKQDESERLASLTHAWTIWTSFVDAYEFDRIEAKLREQLELLASHDEANGALAPPSSSFLSSSPPPFSSSPSDLNSWDPRLTPLG